MSIGRESRSNYAKVLRVVSPAGFLIEHEHLDIRPPLTRSLKGQVVEFTPMQDDNWSRISWRRLGSGKHWWIIADYSKVVDPFLDILPRKQNVAVARLAVGVTGTVSELTLTSVTRVRSGDVIYVENLDPAFPTQNFTTTVRSINTIAKKIQIVPVTLAFNLNYTLSRVSVVKSAQVKLRCPTAQQAFFDSLDFNNPINTFEEG